MVSVPRRGTKFRGAWMVPQVTCRLLAARYACRKEKCLGLNFSWHRRIEDVFCIKSANVCLMHNYPRHKYTCLSLHDGKFSRILLVWRVAYLCTLAYLTHVCTHGRKGLFLLWVHWSRLFLQNQIFSPKVFFQKLYLMISLTRTRTNNEVPT